MEIKTGKYERSMSPVRKIKISNAKHKLMIKIKQLKLMQLDFNIPLKEEDDKEETKS